MPHLQPSIHPALWLRNYFTRNSDPEFESPCPGNKTKIYAPDELQNPRELVCPLETPAELTGEGQEIPKLLEFLQTDIRNPLKQVDKSRT